MKLVPLNESVQLDTNPVSFDRGAKLEVVVRGGTSVVTVYTADKSSVLPQPLVCDQGGIPKGTGNVLGWLEPGSYDLLVGEPPVEGAEDKRQRVPWEASLGDLSELLPTANALTFKGSKDCSANPKYPAAGAGDTYIVSVAGRIGGSSGVAVKPGDLLICNINGTAEGTQAAVGAKWDVAPSLSGLGTAALTDVGAAGEAGKVLAADDPNIALLEAGKLKASELPSSLLNATTAETSSEVPVSDGSGGSAWMLGITDGGDYALDLAQAISAFRSPRAGIFVQALSKAMSGKTTIGSKLVEGVTSANTLFRQGQEVTGTHIPAGTYILGFTTSTTVELSQAATATEEGASLVAVTDYFLIRGLGSSRYERVRLRNYRGSVGGYGLNQIYGSSVCLPMLTHNVVSPSTGITKSGTWTVTTGQPTPALGGPYNTAYSYSTTSGDYFLYETPVVCTAVGVRLVTSINGGLARVEVDGSRTTATLLPTALQLVEDGSYPNTILEEHGGTLKPTDRVLDCNQSDTETLFDRRVVVADGLASAKHTVKVIATGYASLNEDQTGVRTYITGFGYGPTETAITESTVDLYVSDWIMEPRIGSAWEYAIHQKPHGDSAANWTGNIHGHEVQDSLVLSIDGVVSHPTAGTVTQASNYVSLLRHSHIVDAEEEATKVALSETTYRLDRRGLSVTPNLEWVKESVLDNAYSMCPVNGALNPYGKFNRGALIATPSILTLTGVGTGYVGLSKSGAAWMWGSTGRVAQLAYLVNAKDFTDNWQHTTVFTRIQDRGPTEPPACSKIYFPWVTPDASSVTMKVGDRKTWTTRYMAAFASGGINAAMEAI
jgi:hypothetical protein